MGARVLIEDEMGRFLLIKRTDSGDWGLPGGSMELGESLMDVVFREAMEETNATLERVTAFGLSSNLNLERHTYPNGDQLQNVSLLAHGFLANKDFAPDGGEASEIRFLHPSEIDRDRFVATEYPTFSHWQAFKDSGIFQIV
ncbi:NUDIX domain-containing protein [Tritonibacter mobilis]|uniref:NUDIX domain-containing protein n=1 Tax=Tritonibacter mobilis TaxID=379347 RepID=UPI0029820496|nr:NUDIX domain-containing protein [Tritonibacter mobilis]